MYYSFFSVDWQLARQLHCVSVGSIVSRLVQSCLGWFNRVSVGSIVSRLVQSCLGWFNRVSVGSISSSASRRSFDSMATVSDIPTTDNPEIGVRGNRIPVGRDPANGIPESRSGWSLVDMLLEEQQRTTAVEKFSQFHESQTEPLLREQYRDLIPLTLPQPGEQYAFEVDLDACFGVQGVCVGLP